MLSSWVNSRNHDFWRILIKQPSNGKLNSSLKSVFLRLHEKFAKNMTGLDKWECLIWKVCWTSSSIIRPVNLYEEAWITNVMYKRIASLLVNIHCSINREALLLLYYLEVLQLYNHCTLAGYHIIIMFLAKFILRYLSMFNASCTPRCVMRGARTFLILLFCHACTFYSHMCVRVVDAWNR